MLEATELRRSAEPRRRGAPVRYSKDRFVQELLDGARPEISATNQPNGDWETDSIAYELQQLALLQPMPGAGTGKPLPPDLV